MHGNSPGQFQACFCLATDSEDDQIHQRTLLDEDTCSDTVSLVGQRNSGRRLRLRWSEHTPPVNTTSNVQVPDVPDSHDRRFDASACSDAARQSATGGETSSRSGPVSAGAC